MVKKQAAQKSLKAKNLKWLVPLFSVNAILVAGAIFGTDAIQAVIQGKKSSTMLNTAALSSLAALATVVMASVLPTSWKDVLVFWRLTNVLPGHRAFTVHAKLDPRYTMQQLVTKLGTLPRKPQDQNALWYSLLKKHENRVEVLDAHQMFLLFRDGTSLSTLALVVYLLASTLGGGLTDLNTEWAMGFAIQAVFMSLAARQTGYRLVRNVLAIEVL